MTCVLTLGVRPAGGFRYLNYVAVEKIGYISIETDKRDKQANAG